MCCWQNLGDYKNKGRDNDRNKDRQLVQKQQRETTTTTHTHTHTHTNTHTHTHTHTHIYIYIYIYIYTHTHTNTKTEARDNKNREPIQKTTDNHKNLNITKTVKHQQKQNQTTNTKLTARNRQRRTTRRCLFVGCLTSLQQASVSQGRICSDNFTCCHTEIQVADQTFYLTQSQHTDTGPTSPSADPITPDAWQGSHWSANFEVTGMTRPRKNPVAGGIRARDLLLSRRTP